MADPLATWSLDLTHDGVDERVSVYSAILGEPEAGIFYLLVMDEGEASSGSIRLPRHTQGRTACISTKRTDSPTCCDGCLTAAAAGPL